MKNYAIYLRKSRADLEAEARGEGETLARHRKALWALAERRELNVVREYAEIITGDSIAARPQMQQLLEDVKQGLYAGVLVNDIDRLGRGDSIDQEIIKLTFAAAHCIIITPNRDINPASPTDEDMLDFSMFFARFEYRKISQRLYQGRTRSAMSGNYISARIPYGYRKVVIDNRITLEPDPDAAKIVRMIFDWYSSKTFGFAAIATALNDLGLKTYRGYPFTGQTIRAMLKNPIYTGRIAWGRTSTISTFENGTRKKKHVKSEPVFAENAHPAIISDEQFKRVQEMFREADHKYPKNTNAKLVNPLAGLIYCAECGRALAIRGKEKGARKERILTCVFPSCPTKGTYISVIVNAVLEALQGWCVTYEEPVEESTISINTDLQETIRRQIETLEGQLKKAQEFVELGIYTPSEYIKRKGELQERIDALKEQAKQAEQPEERSAPIHDMLPEIKNVLEAYPMAQTVEQQNALLKSVVARIELKKTQAATKSTPPEQLMELRIFPRVRNGL